MREINRQQNTFFLNTLAQSTNPTTPESRRAMDKLFACTIEELRFLANAIMSQERAGHVLQPTALVNEAYLSLFDQSSLDLQSKAHFINLAAKVMRRLLVDQARKRDTQKRGKDWQAVTLSGVAADEISDQLDLLALDGALENLGEIDPRAIQVVELRIFGGLTMEEIAEQMDVSRRTVQKDWRFATMWLRRELNESSDR